jgi:hypothetical protein
MNNKARALALSLALIGLAQLVAASLATASPVYPADFFTQATTQVWGNATDSGQLGTSAQSTNLVTTLYRSANGTFNTTGDGAVASMGGAAASANLATGQLRAEAGATLLVPALANAVGFPAQATTYMGDTLFFTAPGASLTTITTVGFTIHVEGTLTPIPNAGTSSGMGRGQFAIYIGQDSVLGGFDSTAVNVFQHYNHSENWYGTPLGTVTINEDIVGSFKFKGAAATVPILMWLLAGGQYGYGDLGNTVNFSFNPLSAGVSFTSASGAFLVGEVPLPAALPLFASGLGLIAVLGWRRNRKAAGCT